jgi:hypothetical protein
VVAVIRKQPWELASDSHVLRQFFNLMKQSHVIVTGSGIETPSCVLSAEEQEKLDLCMSHIGAPRREGSW